MEGEGKGKGKGNTKGKGGGEGKGKGGGGGEDRVKAYGNITVSMIMQRSFIRYSYWFCSAQKRNFFTEIAFFCGQSLEKKKSVQELRETSKNMPTIFQICHIWRRTNCTSNTFP